MSTSIREQIRQLAAEWFNVEYAKRVNVPTILKDLCAEAFIRGEPRHSEIGLLLLTANRRLMAGSLDGDYAKGDYFVPDA